MALSPPAAVRLGRHPAFVRFWLSRVASVLAFQMTGVAVGWLIYDLTGSALALGLVGLAQFLPMLALTLVVGHVADTFNRKRVVAICQALAAATLLLVAAGLLTGIVGVAGIYAAVAVIGAARAFEHPTMQALLPGLVPREALPRALALATSALEMATIAGPAVGGLIYGLGREVPFAAAALCYGLAAIAMASIPYTPAPRRTGPVTLSFLLSGLAFIRRKPVVLGSISLDLFAVLLGGVTALLPIFARDILQVGTTGLGALRAAPALGAVMMALALAHVPLARQVGPKMFAAVMVFGLATIVFALSANFYLSFAALFVLGVADTVSVVIRSSLVQLATPDDMRGRVSAVNSLFIGTSNQLGEFESGVAAALLGAVGAGLAGGIGTVVVALLWMRLFPELLRTDTLPRSP